ncbi:MAG: hypothetical protein Q7J35_01920 [Candidatus Methanoperedens sp.]|nr:hypothetical protein [Candidatus Methanoperedens sp.]
MHPQGCSAPSSAESVTRASKQKKESQNNRTPEENAGKTQYTACVHMVKIPLHRSAPVQRERVVRYREVSCGVPVSATTALNISEPKVALMRCDVPVTCGSLDRIMNIGVLWQGWLRMLSIVTKGDLLTSSMKSNQNPTSFWVT